MSTPICGRGSGGGLLPEAKSMITKDSREQLKGSKKYRDHHTPSNPHANSARRLSLKIEEGSRRGAVSRTPSTTVDKP